MFQYEVDTDGALIFGIYVVLMLTNFIICYEYYTIWNLMYCH